MTPAKVPSQAGSAFSVAPRGFAPRKPAPPAQKSTLEPGGPATPISPQVFAARPIRFSILSVGTMPNLQPMRLGKAVDKFKLVWDHIGGHMNSPASFAPKDAVVIWKGKTYFPATLCDQETLRAVIEATFSKIESEDGWWGEQKIKSGGRAWIQAPDGLKLCVRLVVNHESLEIFNAYPEMLQGLGRMVWTKSDDELAGIQQATPKKSSKSLKQPEVLGEDPWEESEKVSSSVTKPKVEDKKKDEEKDEAPEEHELLRKEQDNLVKQRLEPAQKKIVDIMGSWREAFKTNLLPKNKWLVDNYNFFENRRVELNSRFRVRVVELFESLNPDSWEYWPDYETGVRRLKDYVAEYESLAALLEKELNLDLKNKNVAPVVIPDARGALT